MFNPSGGWFLLFNLSGGWFLLFHLFGGRFFCLTSLVGNFFWLTSLVDDFFCFTSLVGDFICFINLVDDFISWAAFVSFPVCVFWWFLFCVSSLVFHCNSLYIWCISFCVCSNRLCWNTIAASCEVIYFSIVNSISIALFTLHMTNIFCVYFLHNFCRGKIPCQSLNRRLNLIISTGSIQWFQNISQFIPAVIPEQCSLPFLPCNLNPRLLKGGYHPLTVSPRLHQNAKQSDPGHL